MIWKYVPDSNVYQSIDFLEYTPVTRAARRQESIEGFTEKVHAVFTVEGYENMPISDFPSMGRLLPIFSERALDVLWPLIKDNVVTSELRWINYPEQRIYAVYVLKKVDCLDKEKSELTYFSDGTILSIRKPVFIEERAEGEHMFKLSDERVNSNYVSDKFRRTVVANGLIGLVFEHK